MNDIGAADADVNAAAFCSCLILLYYIDDALLHFSIMALPCCWLPNCVKLLINMSAVLAGGTRTLQICAFAMHEISSAKPSKTDQYQNEWRSERKTLRPNEITTKICQQDHFVFYFIIRFWWSSRLFLLEIPIELKCLANKEWIDWFDPIQVNFIEFQNALINVERKMHVNQNPLEAHKLYYGSHAMAKWSL